MGLYHLPQNEHISYAFDIVPDLDFDWGFQK